MPSQDLDPWESEDRRENREQRAKKEASGQPQDDLEPMIEEANAILSHSR